MHILCPHCRNPIELVRLIPREEITCPSCGSSFHLETGSTTGENYRAGQKLGKFELIAVIGHGAYGTVYQARDPELDRTVALKVPRAGNLAGPQELDRFLREARSAAQLRHPSIVSVHDVGQVEGVPYLVSDFVQGVTLTDLLSARRPSFRESVELIATVADALQYAHERGVVHRDVKPSNIMIAEDGTPHVMDFGLAKRDAGEITMTIEGQVLGTPAYMPPEQARGEGHAVDARGDVYSLGVVLYQLLTGELPFRGTQRMLLHQVLHDEPRAPRSLNDHIPRDLETVTLKAMAKEPGRRYASAREMADDLRRWLNGEPIEARPVGRLERGVRWARRRPAAAALMAVSVVAMLALVGLAVGLVYNVRLGAAYDAEAEARGEAETARLAEEEQRMKAEGALQIAEKAKRGEEEQRKRAEDALTRAEEIGYFHSIFLADTALRDNNVALAQQRLKETKSDQRGWEWYYLNGRCHSELLAFPGGRPVFSPNGKLIAAAGLDGLVRICNTATGMVTLTLKGPKAISNPVFRADGTHIAVASRDWKVRVYDIRTGQETFVLQDPAVPAAFDANPFFNQMFDSMTGPDLSWPPPAFSPDGTRIAVASIGGVVRVFDARTGKEILILRGPAKLAQPVFSPDGMWIMTAPALPATSGGKSVGGDGMVRVFDMQTGKEAFVLKGPKELSNPVISPDGGRIAVEGWTGEVRVFDSRTRRETVTIVGPKRLSNLVFSPDGARIAAKDHINGLVRVYDARTGQEAFALKVAKSLSSLSGIFSPDGANIAVEDVNGIVRVVDARFGHEIIALKGAAVLSNPVFSPDGTCIAVTGRDWMVRVYDARNGQEPIALKGPAGLLGRPVFSSDGTRIAAHCRDGLVRAYDARSGLETVAIKGPNKLYHPEFSPDGSRIAAVGGNGDRLVRIFDTRTGQEEFVLKGSAALFRPMFSREGTRIMRVGIDRVVRVYDARTGLEAFALEGPRVESYSAFTSDGMRIVTVAGDRTVRVYDARTGQITQTFKGPARSLLTVSIRDGARAAAAGSDGVVRVYDLRTGKETLTFKMAKGPNTGLWFSPDGTRLIAADQPGIAAGGDGVVRLYDTHTGQNLVTLKGPAGLGLPEFSPDGKRIAVQCGGAVRLFHALTGQETLVLKGAAPFSSPVFSPDGKSIAVAPAFPKGDGVIRVFEAPTDILAWQARRRAMLVRRAPE